jgi:hypothetical protein
MKSHEQWKGNLWLTEKRGTKGNFVSLFLVKHLRKDHILLAK